MGYTFKLCAKMSPSPPTYPCRVLGYGEKSNIEFFKWLVEEGTKTTRLLKYELRNVCAGPAGPGEMAQ